MCDGWLLFRGLRKGRSAPRTALQAQRLGNGSIRLFRRKQKFQNQADRMEGLVRLCPMLRLLRTVFGPFNECCRLTSQGGLSPRTPRPSAHGSRCWFCLHVSNPYMLGAGASLWDLFSSPKASPFSPSMQRSSLPFFTDFTVTPEMTCGQLSYTRLSASLSCSRWTLSGVLHTCTFHLTHSPAPGRPSMEI